MSYTGNLSTHRGLIGKIGEDIACEYLESIGHQVLERNYRIRIGEIDIITRKGNILHFVEVKTTQSLKTTPEEHLDAVKMRKMKKLAELYFNGFVNTQGRQKYEEENFGIYLDFVGVVLAADRSVQKITYLEMLEV